MTGCTAFNCNNRDTRENREKCMTFHKFPFSNSELLKKWVVNMKRVESPGIHWIPTKYMKLCSAHFTPDCFDRTGQTARLRPNVVPTIFQFPKHLKQIVTPRTTKTAQKTDIPLDLDQPSASASTSASSCEYTISSEHDYAIHHSPRKLRKMLADSQERADKVQKKLNSEIAKTRRLRRKVSELSSVVECLKEKGLISDNCAEVLKNTFSGIPMDIMLRVLQKGENAKSRAAYSEELKAFAMTLQFYSAKAYEYVRETFDLALPHSRQIRSWYTDIEGDAGFTRQAFQALSQQVLRDKAEKRETLCCLMLDEMALRKHFEFMNNKYHGFVDIGNGVTDDSAPMAKDALVLMAVSVNSSWKIPLGYFLIDGMSGKERANLVRESECFHRLHETGVTTIALTCDGPSCHVAMLNELGASMIADRLRPSFPHPANHAAIVHVLLDVCHMLKLVRNAFAEGVVCTDGNQREISWSFIEMLHAVQEKEGLRLANKLKIGHIEWRKQKMKVHLAAQAISSSVADALSFCEHDLQRPEFRGSEGTVQFLKSFDAIFDLLNSRNPCGKGLKAPMKSTNQEQWRFTIDFGKKYIMGLRMEMIVLFYTCVFLCGLAIGCLIGGGKGSNFVCPAL